MIPRKRKRPILVALLAVLAIWLGFGLWVVYEVEIRPPSVHVFPAGREPALTEKEALLFTRQALERDGETSSRLEAIRFRNGNPQKQELYLEREKNNANAGRIRWKGRWEYSVRIEKTANGIRCTDQKLE